MTRTVRIVIGIAVAVLLVGVAATAVANRSAFQEVADHPADASATVVPDIEPPPTEDEPTDVVINPLPTPSLDAVREADLLPFEWPWFADGVPVPEDALANGEDFVSAIGKVPGLADFKVLSATRMEAEAEGLDLGIRKAWLRVGPDEVMRIGTQRLTTMMTIPIGQGEAVISYGAGEAVVSSEPWEERVLYVIPGRQVIVELKAVGEHAIPVSMTSDQLLELASDLAAVLER